MAFEGAGAGSRSQAGLGGEWPGRNSSRRTPLCPHRRSFQSHFCATCAHWVGSRWLMSARTDPRPCAPPTTRPSAPGGARCSAPCSSPPATRATSPSARPRSCRSAWPPSRCPSSSPRRRSTPGCACRSSRSARRARRPKGTGVRYAVGELLTCTRCVGVWSALGLTALRVTRPREARVVNTVSAPARSTTWPRPASRGCARARTRPCRPGAAPAEADRAAWPPAGAGERAARGRSTTPRAALRVRLRCYHEGWRPPAGAPGQAASAGAALRRRNRRRAAGLGEDRVPGGRHVVGTVTGWSAKEPARSAGVPVE